jgi:hypothetical protein
VIWEIGDSNNPAIYSNMYWYISNQLTNETMRIGVFGDNNFHKACLEAERLNAEWREENG